jgi:hypothetical protein
MPQRGPGKPGEQHRRESPDTEEEVCGEIAGARDGLRHDELDRPVLHLACDSAGRERDRDRGKQGVGDRVVPPERQDRGWRASGQVLLQHLAKRGRGELGELAEGARGIHAPDDCAQHHLEAREHERHGGEEDPSALELAADDVKHGSTP